MDGAVTCARASGTNLHRLKRALDDRGDIVRQMFVASIDLQPDVEPLNGYDSRPRQFLPTHSRLLDGATVSINDPAS